MFVNITRGEIPSLSIPSIQIYVKPYHLFILDYGDSNKDNKSNWSILDQKKKKPKQKAETLKISANPWTFYRHTQNLYVLRKSVFKQLFLTDVWTEFWDLGELF